MTASAAAFNSHMGLYSMRFGPAVIFLMTALNLRLGLWLRHPSDFPPASPSIRRRLVRWFVGSHFYKELLGYSRAENPDVLLSDGGHFENMALYELIRRRCRFILASDSGMDKDIAFDDFGNLVRRVRLDFGADINIDLAPLRPDEQGFAQQHMVAGDIHYQNGDTGVLLFFKPTLTGDEPTDVTQYKRRNPLFPHQSTGDQFYDEAQWESYRRLGQHAVESAFAFLAKAEADLLNNPSRIFAHARRDWLPIPNGYQNRVSLLATHVAELEELLHTGSCERLLWEVYKEIDQLDQQARSRQYTNGSSPPSAHQGDIHADSVANDLEVSVKTLAPPQPSMRTAPGLFAPDLDKEDIVVSLHLIRRGIAIMEEVYLSEDLERRHNHPLYLGVMNYFARWAFAPLFRMWWPLLKTMYSHRFTRFMENHFGLATLDDGSGSSEEVHLKFEGYVDGFAMDSWVRMRKGAQSETEPSFASYVLEMRYRDQKPYQIQAAQVCLSPGDGVVGWDAADFFVPPGLWGVGIGERFLDALVRRRGSLPGGPSHLVVRIKKPSHEDTAQKSVATEVQLYRSAKFVRADATRDQLAIDGQQSSITIPHALMPDDQNVDQFLWLVL